MASRLRRGPFGARRRRRSLTRNNILADFGALARRQTGAHARLLVGQRRGAQQAHVSMNRPRPRLKVGHGCGPIARSLARSASSSSTAPGGRAYRGPATRLLRSAEAADGGGTGGCRPVSCRPRNPPSRAFRLTTEIADLASADSDEVARPVFRHDAARVSVPRWRIVWHSTRAIYRWGPGW
jgi:hypothetical protein